MTTSKEVVSREEWLRARKALLVKEKELTHMHDALSRARLELPWVRVEPRYEFESSGGSRSLAELFEGRSQLLVYHFMFGPSWKEGCPSCSVLADHIDASRVHLAARDVTLVVVSRAEVDAIEAFKARMGWRFPWYSSFASTFNFDFGVSFTAEEHASGKARYNYAASGFPSEEAPGLSAFVKDGEGTVYHTYSSYGRGLESAMNVYDYLDLAPKGRNEQDLPWPMAWVRHHDRYDAG